MKPVDVKVTTHIDSIKEVNNIDHEFNDHECCQNIKVQKHFCKGYTPNWSENIFVIKNFLNTVPWTHDINDLKEERKKSLEWKK